MPPERPTLDCTCLRLRQAMRSVSQHYDDSLRSVGLRNTQFSLLGTLVPGPLTINELAEAMIADPTTLNRNLKPLEGRGLLETRRGTDRRERVVTLTTAGCELYEEALPHWRRAQSDVRILMGRDERDAMHALLKTASRIAYGDDPASEVAAA